MNKPGKPPGDTRAQLVAAFEQLLEERPISAISIRDITSAAHVSNPTLYYHFGKKEDLYRTLLEERLTELRDAVRQVAANGGDDAGRRLIDLANAFMDGVFRLPAPNAILRELVGQGGLGVQRAVFRAERDVRSYFEDALRFGIGKGDFRAELDVRITAISIVGLLSLFAVRRLAEADDPDDAGVRLLRDVVIPGMSRRAVSP
ncbi:MAG: TetR/AcrR family transcriptional regulator [Dehalococcoidia bacterium]